MPEVTESQVKRFRNAVGDSKTPPKFEKSVIQDYFDNALEDYPTLSAKGILYAAIVQGVEKLLAESIEEVSYTENTASETLTDKRKGYEALLKLHKGNLSEELGELETDEADVPVAWGSTVKTPRREEEYPNA